MSKKRSSLDELIDILQSMTPEQIQRMLAHPAVVQIMEDSRNGGGVND